MRDEPSWLSVCHPLHYRRAILSKRIGDSGSRSYIIIERQEDTCPCGLFSQRLTPSKASLYPCCIDWMLYHVQAGL